MGNSQKDDDAKRDEILKRMLATPPQPKTDKGGKSKKKPDKRKV